jgi:hypothetical protein
MLRTATAEVGGGKRYPLGLRTTKELRERLEAARAASGRSLAQEVEYRLEQSFGGEHRGDLLDELLTDQALRTQATLMVLNFDREGRAAAAAKGIDTAPHVWMRDSDCYRAACGGAMAACGIATGTARGRSAARARSE